MHILSACWVPPGSNRLIDAMFEDRKKLFVDLMRWDVPVIEDRFEVDQFDGNHATYLIALDDDGSHVGSMRLLPSTGPHLLNTIFADLCDGNAPVGDTIAEITRLCLPTRHGARQRLVIRNRLISAMVDHALDACLTHLTGVVELSFLTEILQMGWRCETLGAPKRYDGPTLGAFMLSIDADTPEHLARTGIFTSGALSSVWEQTQ